MFNFSEWVVKGVIDGFKTGLTPFAKVTELTANYLAKGIITQEQAISIAEVCPGPVTESDGEQNG
jgi:hypothetical protein